MDTYTLNQSDIVLLDRYENTFQFYIGLYNGDMVKIY